MSFWLLATIADFSLALPLTAASAQTLVILQFLPLLESAQASRIAANERSPRA